MKKEIVFFKEMKKATKNSIYYTDVIKDRYSNKLIISAEYFLVNIDNNKWAWISIFSGNRWCDSHNDDFEKVLNKYRPYTKVFLLEKKEDILNYWLSIMNNKFFR